MNIEKLYVGKSFKNYKVMCAELEMKVKSGNNSKNHQLKTLGQYCKFEKQGHIITIVEVFEIPIPKYDGRGKAPNRIKPIYIDNPKLAEQWLVEENGMELPITLTRTSTEEYWWKCSDCKHKIFLSPAKRFNKCKGTRDENITCPYCYLSKGAKRVYDVLEYLNIRFKTEYRFDDLFGVGNKKLRFDFALLDNGGNLLSLIEFDGTYHDENFNKDYEYYVRLTKHDKLKDEYCLNNKIPLLRINHSEENEIEFIVSNFLKTINFPNEIMEFILNKNKQKILNSILEYENKKLELQYELTKIESKLNKLKEII